MHPSKHDSDMKKISDAGAEGDDDTSSNADN
jgi:hypothetical protein